MKIEISNSSKKKFNFTNRESRIEFWQQKKNLIITAASTSEKVEGKKQKQEISRKWN